jgi:hypothetical protein
MGTTTEKETMNSTGTAAEPQINTSIAAIVYAMNRPGTPAPVLHSLTEAADLLGHRIATTAEVDVEWTGTFASTIEVEVPGEQVVTAMRKQYTDRFDAGLVDWGRVSHGDVTVFYDAELSLAGRMTVVADTWVDDAPVPRPVEYGGPVWRGALDMLPFNVDLEGVTIVGVRQSHRAVPKG